MKKKIYSYSFIGNYTASVPIKIELNKKENNFRNEHLSRV